MIRIVFYFLFSLLLTGCDHSLRSSKESSSWPSFRGNSSLQGYAAVDIPAETQLLWTVENKVRTVSSPVVLEGTVYWCDRRGKITGVDTAGQPVFEYDFATAVDAPLMAYDSVLYVARIDGTLSALSLRSRNILWEYETEGQLSGSANIIEEGGRRYILFGSYDYSLYCLDAATGMLISRFESDYYINGAVAASGRFAVFGGCDALVRKIDVLEGVMTDSLQLEAYVPASPAIDGNTVYIGDYNGTIYAIDLDAMKTDTLYRSGKGEDNAFISTPAVNDGQIVFYGSDKHLRMMTAEGAELWKFLIGETGESAPVLTRKHVLACSRSGVVYLLDRKTGILQWRYDTGEQITASPAVVSGRFYILTDKGTLFCFGGK